MPATPTQARICNAALAELGSSERIVALASDAGTVASQLRALWDETLRLLLAEHPWNFAIKRATLNASSPDPTTTWERAFTLPADCLRLLPGGPEHSDTWNEGEREGNLYLTDGEAPLTVRYISGEAGDTVSRWPPHFVHAFTLMLAERMAEAITQSESIKDKMETKAEKALIKAKRINGLETGYTHRAQATVRSDWLSARTRPYYNYGR